MSSIGASRRTLRKERAKDEAAIKKTEVLGDVDRAELLGAREMATAFLFDIEGYNQPSPKT